ncbi:LCP family protein [Raineyella fluvialis]|uniref:LytR family transcriptional regulator n=1 Tax=Raineyella fluvialis TaxID=2662261 RepID=A0A5Q2F7R6_9ACTN|nr:LCP family protein [Raineyella fluvialis]QGF22501.1 LytR family transcriptional regulator [Raineyella fluvialis]
MAGRDDLDWLYGRNDDAPDPSRPFGEDPAPSRASARADGRRDRREDLPPAPPSPPRSALRGGPSPRPSAPAGRPPAPADPRPNSLGSRPAGGGPRIPTILGRGRAGRPRSTVPRGRRIRRRVLTVVAVLLVYLLAFPAWAWFGSARVNATPAGQRPGRQPGITLLLTGSDSRVGLTADQTHAIGGGSSDSGRTDSIMLLHVPVVGAPALVSIPRDSYVAIPGHGKNKINAAYAFGGPDLLAQTIEQDTGVRIDGYVGLGFEGFVSIIDSLGGIPMCLDSPMKDQDAHVDLPAGCQTLSGAQALGYVRMRHADPLGDIGRVKRQREMVGATVKKAVSPLTVINPIRWIGLNNAVRGAVSRGKDTGPLDGSALLYGAAVIGGGGGHTISVPTSNTNYRTPVGDAVLWDEAKAAIVFGAMKTGNTTNLGQFDKKD